MTETHLRFSALNESEERNPGNKDRKEKSLLLFAHYENGDSARPGLNGLSELSRDRQGAGSE